MCRTATKIELKDFCPNKYSEPGKVLLQACKEAMIVEEPSLTHLSS